MTREEFIKLLEKENQPYEIDGDKIVVVGNGDVKLNGLKTIPSDVVFKNGETVWLGSLTTLPPGVAFENGWNVWLGSLTTLPSGMVFNNQGGVLLNNLTSIPHDVIFNNGADVKLNKIIGGWFYDWSGNIKKLNNKRLLNKMINKGVFER